MVIPRIRHAGLHVPDVWVSGIFPKKDSRQAGMTLLEQDAFFTQRQGEHLFYFVCHYF